MKRITVIGMLLLAAILQGCATAVSSGYGQGGQNADGRSYEEARADNQITAAITSLLVRNRSIPAMDIDVSTLNGVVTLAGSVPDAATAERAAALAAGVSGVERVINRLQVAR